MKLTADEIRLALNRASDEARGENCSCLSTAEDAQNGVLAVIDVLLQVLPDIVAPAQKIAIDGSQDTGPGSPQRESSRFQGWCYLCQAWFTNGLEHFNAQGHQTRHVERLCPDCTPEQPCDRVRELIGE